MKGTNSLLLAQNFISDFFHIEVISHFFEIFKEMIKKKHFSFKYAYAEFSLKIKLQY